MRSDTRGWFNLDVRHPNIPNGRFRKRFKTKELHDLCRDHIKAKGEIPAWAWGNGGEARADVRTFGAVYLELKENGGPGGLWRDLRDPEVIRRCETLCNMPVGTLDVTQITYDVGEATVRLLRKRRYRGQLMANSTINRYLTALSTVLTYAEEKQYIKVKPRLPWQQERKHKQTLYTDTMEDAVCGWLEAQGWRVDALVVRVLSVTGLRVGELLGNPKRADSGPIRPEQIDEDFVVLDDPHLVKNGETREVHVGYDMARELRAAAANGALPNYATFSNHLRAALKSCGYEMSRIVHALRHTAATRIVDLTGDLQVAQQLLGHRSIATTARYRQTSRELLRQRATKVAHSRGKSQPATPATVSEIKDLVRATTT